jgi:hypothetical protein
MCENRNGVNTFTLINKTDFSLSVRVRLLLDVSTVSMLAGLLLIQRECFSRTITNEQINA